MKRVLVTGANGFVGRALCQSLLKGGYVVRAAVRSKKAGNSLSPGIEITNIGEINETTDWKEALRGVDTIIHLASRVHIMQDAVVNPLGEYRSINTEGTRKLADAAVMAGVRRIVYLSTVKVNGEQTQAQAFSENDAVQPSGPYALSKHEAELILNDMSRSAGLEVVILRPPLVYGPNVKANFYRLIELVMKGMPLPLSLINNKRSMIYLGNLVDAITKCIEHLNAANQTFLVCDGHDVSTPDLIRLIAWAMGKRPRLIPIPSFALNAIGKITGKTAEIERLTSSLQIDNSKIRKTLNWTPPFTMEEGLKATAEWFKSGRL